MVAQSLLILYSRRMRPRRIPVARRGRQEAGEADTARLTCPAAAGTYDSNELGGERNRVRDRIIARRAAPAAAPRVEHDPAVLASFLSDAAHVPGGFAAGVSFPRDEGEVSALIADAARVLPIGAQSSLTGGATPRGDLVLSSRALTGIHLEGSSVRVGAGVSLCAATRAGLLRVLLPAHPDI